MKHMKKIASFVLAAIMVLAMVVPTFAANHKISTSSTTHTYEIYQIFTGTVVDGNLTSLKYGENAKTGTKGNAVSAADITALAAISDQGSTVAQDQADIAAIKAFVDLSSTPIAKVGKGQSGEASVAEGYYLIKDVDGSLAGTNEQYTLYLIEVLSSDLTITPKAGTTTSVKKIDDINDSTGTAENLQDSADYDIGDYVPFHLTANTASNVSAYKTYHLTFEDTLESGKFDNISALTFKVNGVAITEFPYTDSVNGFKVTKTETVAPTKDGFTVKLTFESTTAGGLLPAYLNSKAVTIDFSAQLGENANIGQAGNVNTFVLKYSNNPNSTDDSEEGTTPEDTVIAFTYKLIVNKQDEGGNALTGATFSLYKKYATAPTGGTAYAGAYDFKDKGYYLVKTITGTDKSTFEFKGIDDGQYLLVEDTAPENYNKIDPQEFTVTATHTASTDIDKASKKDGSGNYILTNISGAQVVSSTITLTKIDDNSGLQTNVVNKSGATLPTTGGIGTTIFYVLGSILVLGAVILLATRRRMSR